MNSAVVATSLVRSHVVFKFLNDVTDKIIRIVLTTLCAYVKVCANYMCQCASVRERAGERESRLCAFRT